MTKRQPTHTSSTHRAHQTREETCPIPLSRAAQDALDREVTRGEWGYGGYQKFLRKLQHQYTDHTDRLDLTPTQMERVFRYVHHENLGGYQWRLIPIWKDICAEMRWDLHYPPWVSGQSLSKRKGS